MHGPQHPFDCLYDSDRIDLHHFGVPDGFDVLFGDSIDEVLVCEILDFVDVGLVFGVGW